MAGRSVDTRVASLMRTNSPWCWTMTTGEAGMTNQALGLAEALGWPGEHKTIGLRRPWRWLPAHRCPDVFSKLTADSDPVVPPWPDVLITSGRRSAGVSIAIRRASAGRTFTVHLQDPQIPPQYFDVVVPPRHDGLTGPNVLPTRGALHRVTAAKRAQAAEQQAARFAALPQPLVAVLVGGSNRHCRLTPALSTTIGQQLRDLALTQGVGLAITPSRRTGSENSAALRAALGDVPHYFWDGSGDNPYFALLGLADTLLVTGDSASMVSEACSTGKPVYIIDLPNYGRRLQVFPDELRREGVTRVFTGGPLACWDYVPIDDTPHVAAYIRRLLVFDPYA